MTIFESILTAFEASVIFEAAGAVVKISSSLRTTTFNQVKFVQIRDTYCRVCITDLDQLNLVKLG